MMVMCRRVPHLSVVAVVILALSFGTLRAESETWRTVVPSQAGILRAVWGHSPQGVFAVGDGGTILHFDGAAWQPMESGTDRDLSAVWGSGPSRVFAAGREGTLLYFDGTRWRGLDSGTGADLHAVWGHGGSEVFAAGGNGVILRFDGVAWRPMDSGVGTSILSLWGNSGADIFAVGGGGVILKYSGSRWYPMKSGTGMALQAVWGASGSDVFAVGSGLVLHYNGREWMDESDGSRNVRCLWGTSGTHVYSGGDGPDEGGGVVRRYDGSAWHEEGIDAAAPIQGLWGDQDGNVFAVGGSRDIGGVIYRFDGENWSEAWRQPEESLSKGLQGLWIGSDGQGLAVGDGGRTLLYDRDRWTSLDAVAQEGLRGAWGIDGHLFVLGEEGVVLQYDGSRWETISDKGLTDDLNAVWGYSEADAPGEIHLVAVGDDGTILTYGRGAWESVDSGINTDLNDVFGISGSDIFAVGDDGVILHFDGARWHAMKSPTASNLWGIWAAGSADAFAVGDSNTILHFDGWQWREMADDAEKIDHFECVWGRSGTDVYATGNNGVIQHYDGVAWRRMTSGTAANLLNIEGTSDGVLFAVDSDGAVHRAEAVTLSLPDGVEEGAGAASVQGVVSIPSPRALDLVISVVSDDPAEVRVPGAVTIPAGEVNAGFDIDIRDNGIADGTRMVQVTAAAPGLLSAAALMTVVDNETATLFLDIPREAFEGDDLAGQGRVRMNVVALRDVTVALVSDTPGAATVPPTVLIPAGTDQAAFDVRVTDDPVIDEVQTAVVTAHVAGWTGGSSTINVLDDDRYGLTLTLATAAMETDGQVPGAGKVSVPVPFPQDVMVSLMSGDITEVTVPEMVIIRAGETSSVFDIYPVRDFLIDDPQPVLISAASPGFRGDEKTVKIQDGDGVWTTVERGTDLLRGVWGSAGNHVYAVGSFGAISHYDGERWQYMGSPVYDTLYDVWGASENDIFAVGGSPSSGTVILHYDGNAWREMSVGRSETINGVWGISGSDVYAVGGSSSAGGIIFHYDGREWREIANHKHELENVWGASENDLFAVGQKGAILHFDGTGWREMDSGTDETFYGVWGTSGSHVFAAGKSGVILHFDGESWQTMDSGVTDHIYGLWGCSETDVYAVGRKGRILRYDGSGWRPVDSGSEESLWAAWGVCSEGGAAAEVFAVGSEGQALRFDGAEWQLDKAVDIDFHDVWGGAVESKPGFHAFTVGNTGLILENDGDAWVQVENGFFPGLNGVWGYAADRMYTVGDVGTILGYDGYRWRKMPSATYADLNDISGCFTDAGLQMVAVGDNGTILAFDGMQWQSLDSGTEAELYGVWLTPFQHDGSLACEGFAVGRNGLILHYDGRTWQPMESGATRHLYDIWGSSSTDVYAVGHYGTLLHYDGFHWQPVETGKTITFRGVWGRSPSDVFAVGSVGTILHYDGAQWIEMEAPSVTCKSVWGSGRTVFVVGWQNFILQYSDVGLRLPELAVEGDGLLAGQAEVYLDRASAEDRVVTLVSHDPEEIVVPATVTIPAGALSAAFDLTIVDDARLDGTRRVTLTADVPGLSLGTGFVSVVDNETAVLTLSLPDAVTEGEIPDEGCCRVDVDRPVDRDVSVILTSGDPAKLRVPTEVTIPAGETGATVELTVMDDRVFDGDRPIEIAAHVAGWTGNRKPVTVLDNEITELTLELPGAVAENDGILSAGGRVSIPGIWTSDLTVALASDLPGQVAVPPVVIIPAGRMQADFYLAVTDDALINGSRTATLTASAAGWTEASNAVEIVDNDPGILQFSTDRYMALESEGMAVVTVIREQSSSGRITVDVETLDGSATAGVDYAPVSGTLIFEDGETQESFSIAVSADDGEEGGESIRLNLSNPGLGAALGDPCAAEVMLVEAVSWQDNAAPFTDNHLKGLWGSNGQNVFAVGWRGTIFRYDGSGWEDMSLALGETLHLEAVWGSSATDVFAVGAEGIIIHYDGGKTFEAQESGTESHLYGVWGASAKRVFAVGAGVIVGYDGNVWREMAVEGGVAPDLKGIWGTAENDVFAVGYDGMILHYDGGAWRAMDSGTTDHLYGVWGVSGTDVFAVGAFGTILHYDGAGWHLMENNADRPVLFLDSVWGSSSADVFAVGYDGMILHYDGHRWQPDEASAGYGTLNAVWGPSGAGAGLDVLAIGEGGRMLHYAPDPAP